MTDSRASYCLVLNETTGAHSISAERIAGIAEHKLRRLWYRVCNWKGAQRVLKGRPMDFNEVLLTSSCFWAKVQRIQFAPIYFHHIRLIKAVTRVAWLWTCCRIIPTYVPVATDTAVVLCVNTDIPRERGINICCVHVLNVF